MALDPRTKLYLVALANLLLFFHVDVVVESRSVFLLLLALLGAGRWGAGGRVGFNYGFLLVGTWTSTLDDGGSWLHMLGLLCVGIRMMMPCLMPAYTHSPRLRPVNSCVPCGACAFRRRL